MEPVAIPSSVDVRRLLERIEISGLRILSSETGVPFGTLYKISTGETTNPGLETTRRFYARAVSMAAAKVLAHDV